MKRFQNKVAESRLALPVVFLYGTGTWILAGLIPQQWWIQFACFAASVIVMTELCNSNTLIRIYSRMPSCVFIGLSSTACFLFSSIPGAIAQLCIATALLTLFRCYQDRQSAGWIFYTFLLISLASLVCVQVLFIIPVFWLMMALTVYAMSWRTLVASLLGILFPYWVAAAGVLLLNHGDFRIFAEHFQAIADVQFSIHLATLNLPQILTFFLTICLTLAGIIHFLRTSYKDKIRIRQLFYSFIILHAYAIILLVVLPLQSDLLLRVMIITASPLAGHFLALTSTRVTNIVFCTITVVIVLLTAFNLWMLS